jgi:hypothetical protein
LHTLLPFLSSIVALSPTNYDGFLRSVIASYQVPECSKSYSKQASFDRSDNDSAHKLEYEIMIVILFFFFANKIKKKVMLLLSLKLVDYDDGCIKAICMLSSAVFA